MKRSALGKGLGSLIPAAIPAVPARLTEQRVEISRIHPNRHQPRESFDEASLEELARSIKASGVLQPVVVRSDGDGTYELVAGERRWRAAQRAGIHQIPVVVRDVPDEQLLELALIENVQREELNPIEEAAAYRVLVQDLGLTQQEVADRVGKQRATVANALRLLNLPPKVQEMVRSRRLSMGHARALLALENPKTVLDLAERAASGGLSVRDLERATQGGGERALTLRATKRIDPNVAAAQDALERALGAKVKISGGPKSGRIEIRYKGEDDLQRLYETLIVRSKHKIQ